MRLLFDAITAGNLAHFVRILNEDYEGNPNIKRDIKGYSPLIYAICCGHNHIVEYLLDFPTIDLDATDIKGRTPLMYASKINNINMQTLYNSTSIAI